MRASLALLLVAATLCCALVERADARRSLRFCRGSDLTGSFAVVPGSAGAGNIVYALRLKNRSNTVCSLTGTPIVELHGKTGTKLPTRIRPAHPGAQAAVLVTLQPGGRAKATARFTPDVPGPGEPTGAQCEPRAYRLVVHPNGGGRTTVPIVPATPVCVHGMLSFSVYTAA
jgi:Protein of unknown function (DUF4232)